MDATTNWGSKGETVSPHDGKVAAVFVPKGTRCLVKAVLSAGEHRSFSTRRDHYFREARTKRWKYHFRMNGWEMIVPEKSTKRTTVEASLIED